MKKDILVNFPTAPRQMEALNDVYTLHRFDEADAAGRERMLAEAGPRIVGIVTNGHAPLQRDIIDRLPALEIVACSSAGFETIDVAALTERGIPLTNSSDALADDVADTAIMLMLACRRNLIVGDRYVRSGDWGRKGMLPLTSRVAGSKVGIVGLGTIGKAIAARCAVMRLQVGYHARSEKPAEPYRYFAELIALADWADILIAITPGGKATEGLISAAVLKALGPRGTFVNVARGSVVDEAALISALQDGTLGSAGLDVYYNEPHADPAFAGLDNAVLYPHHASGTVETRDAMSQLVVDNLAAHFAGRPLLTPVN